MLFCPKVNDFSLYAGELHAVLTPKNQEGVMFLFCHSGQIRIATEIDTLICRPGSYAFLPHSTNTQVHVDCDSVVLLCVKTDSTTEAIFLESSVYSSDDAACVFKELAAFSNSCDEAAQLQILSLIYSLLRIHQSLSASAQQITPGYLLLCRDYLRNDPVSTYAQACGISETLFRTLFSRQYGMTPIDYRNMLRLQYAKELINVFSIPVSVAAKAAGFNSTSYFCKLYKKTYGVNPTAGEEK